MACTWRRTQWLIKLLVHLTLTITFGVGAAASGDDSEKIRTLLKFKESLSDDNGALSSWSNASTTLCVGNRSNWRGLLCSNGSFYGLQLENMGLRGVIDVEALGELRDLRSISFINNSFDGPMPRVKTLGGGALRGVFLSGNRFSGDIPGDAFAGMNSLRRVNLSHNEFTGEIPWSLAELPTLADLWLDNNRFRGRIPDFKSRKLREVNLSNNLLVGTVPLALQDASPSSLAGNDGLCGKPMPPCKPAKRSFSKVAMIIIIVVGALAAIILASIISFFAIRGKRKHQKAKLGKSSSAGKLIHKRGHQLGNNNSYKDKQQLPATRKELQEKETERNTHDNNNDDNNNNKRSENGKLYFAREITSTFNLEDLLKASAQLLGGGSGFGSSYKAILASGPNVVVKRFRNMSNVEREEFHQHLARLGRLSHPNLLPLVAFYYSKEEKLLITDFVPNGSLETYLHGKDHSPTKKAQPGLDWPTRLKIIKGVGRGLEYLHRELSGLKIPHGHLKSSNVLLSDLTFEPFLADYALSPLVDKDRARQLMVAYKSPESSSSSAAATKKSDVWSLGILILEMLTGKFPPNYLKVGGGNSSSGSSNSSSNNNDDLAAWVNSVVREEWTGEVFDKEMMRGRRNGEGEMLKLLKIGMCCCEWNVERRWDLRVAVEKIEEVKESDDGDDDEDNNYSSYVSEGEFYSSRDFSFSVNK